LSYFNRNQIFSIDFGKNTHKSNFTKTLPEGAELFSVDEQTDRHDGANTDFRNAAIASKNIGSHCTAVCTVIVQELKIWAVCLILKHLF